jgi:hypothetical protein
MLFHQQMFLFAALVLVSVHAFRLPLTTSLQLQAR